MNIGDHVIVKGEVTQIIQDQKGFYIKIRPFYKPHVAPWAFKDEFVVNEESVMNETDEINQMARDYGFEC